MSRSRGFLVAALLAFGAGTARAQSNPAPGVPPEAPVASRGGSVELAVFGGVGGPVGPAGVSAAFLPLSRLAVGLALGSVSVENDVDYGRRSARPALRLAPFVRGYVVDRPAWRLGLGLDAVHGEEVTRHAGTAEDGTPALIFWRRGSANRVDATVLVELVRGDLALRLEAGLGRVFGNASCAARFDLVSVPCREPVLGQSRPQPEVTESASSWRPSLLLALAVRPGGAGGADAAPAAETTRRAGRWRLSVAGTNAHRTDLIDAGQFDAGPRIDAGLETEYLRQSEDGGFRWGAGARNSYGAGSPGYITSEQSEHVAFVPLLFGWARRSRETGEELEVLGGLGPGLMALQTSRDHRQWAFPAGEELGVNYIRPLAMPGRRWALVVGASARVMALWSVHLSGPLGGGHAELPVHVGLRF